jgi:hypothetical protein
MNASEYLRNKGIKDEYVTVGGMAHGCLSKLLVKYSDLRMRGYSESRKPEKEEANSEDTRSIKQNEFMDMLTTGSGKFEAGEVCPLMSQAGELGLHLRFGHLRPGWFRLVEINRKHLKEDTETQAPQPKPFQISEENFLNKEYCDTLRFVIVKSAIGVAEAALLLEGSKDLSRDAAVSMKLRDAGISSREVLHTIRILNS